MPVLKKQTMAGFHHEKQQVIIKISIAAKNIKMRYCTLIVISDILIPQSTPSNFTKKGM